jgi:opacity protein-like surface antigen
VNIKYIFAIVFFSLAAISVQAQRSTESVELGVTIGLNQSNLQARLFDTPFTKGLYAGIVGNYKIKNQWRIHSELVLSQASLNSRINIFSDSDIMEYVDIIHSFNYLEMPVYLSYEKHLSGELSVYPFFGIFQQLLIDYNLDILTENPEEKERIKNLHDKMNLYQAGLLLGAGLHYPLTSNLHLRAEYKLKPSITFLSGQLIEFGVNGDRFLNVTFNFTVTYNPDFKR